jgi:ABC-2 type transport system permease protein
MMRQALAIAWKDTLLRLRDPMALIFSIAAPLVLVLIFGLVFGRSRFEPAVAVLVNHDAGQLGQIYADALTSAEAGEFVRASVMADEAAARAAVDKGDAAAAVIVPAGFTEAIFRGERQQVEVYTDPGQTIGPAIVRSVAQYVTDAITANAATVQTTLDLLVSTGRIAASQQAQVGQQIGQELANRADAGGIALASDAVATDAPAGVLAYLAPALLVFFLMLNAIGSGQHILEEHEGGTLARLFTTPASRLAVVGGKLLGDVLIVGIQAGVLVAGLRLLFGINLGAPLAVALLLLGLALSTIALGILIAGVVPNPRAVSGASQAVALVLGLVGGSFFQPGTTVLQLVSSIAPNHWALDGFLQLVNGGGLADIALPLAVLFGMAAAFALIGAWLLGRRLSEVSS